MTTVLKVMSGGGGGAGGVVGGGVGGGAGGSPQGVRLPIPGFLHQATQRQGCRRWGVQTKNLLGGTLKPV